MTKIAYTSDVHLEFDDLILENTDNVDVLILAGDIVLIEPLHQHDEASYANTPDDKLGPHQKLAKTFRGFLQRVNDTFPKTIMIMGNHEFYHGKFHASVDHWFEELEKYPNIVGLEAGHVEIDGVTFVGGTMWSNHNNGDAVTQYHLEHSMNDFSVVRNDKTGFSKLRPLHTFQRHIHTIRDFNKILDETTGQVVMVTHHAPSFMSIDPMYVRDKDMNGGYASDLSEFILDHPQIKYWIHGHVHAQNNYKIGDTTVLSNPRGYKGYEACANNFTLKTFDL